MTNFEGLTLFTTGVRISVLLILIVVLWNSIKETATKTDNLYSRLAHEPRFILGLVSTLLVTSLIQVAFEMYDHWQGCR